VEASYPMAHDSLDARTGGFVSGDDRLWRNAHVEASCLRRSWLSATPAPEVSFSYDRTIVYPTLTWRLRIYGRYACAEASYPTTPGCGSCAYVEASYLRHGDVGPTPALEASFPVTQTSTSNAHVGGFVSATPGLRSYACIGGFVSGDYSQPRRRPRGGFVSTATRPSRPTPAPEASYSVTTANRPTPARRLRFR
jgi:hypothetical protein